MKAFIKHISYYLPDKIFSNADFFSLFPGELNKSSFEKIGIKNRHVCTDHQTATDLAIKAGEVFFQETGFSRNDIDFLIFNSPDQDYYTPQSSCVIQDALGLPETIGSLDLLHGCSGYPYSLSVVKGLIESGQAKNVLLLTASSLTKVLHKADKASRFLFGDAATATFIQSSEVEGIGMFSFGSRGKDFQKIILRDGYGRNPISSASFVEEVDEFGNVSSPAKLKMDGMGVFLFSVKTVPNLIHELLHKNNLTFDEVDFFVLHQANKLILETIRKKMNIPDDKFIVEMENVGNTVACSIPLAIRFAMDQKQILPGNKVLIAGFGTGLSWSGTVIQV